MTTNTLHRPRLAFERDFTQMPNNWLRDKRVSRGARGLLAELMSHEPGYDISIEALVGVGIEQHAAIRRLVGELESAGYLKRYKRKGKGGRYATYVWVLSDPFDRSPQAVNPELAGLEVVRVKPRSDRAGLSATVLSATDVSVTEDPRTEEDQFKNIYQDLQRQPQMGVDFAVDKSRAVCGHDVSPGTDRCIYACSTEFDMRQAAGA